MLSDLLMVPVSSNGTFLFTMLLLVGLFAGLWSAMIRNGWCHSGRRPFRVDRKGIRTHDLF